MAQIIMLGTEGCGKTILLTVLAHKYRSVNEDGYFLEAMNADANAFTNQNWHILEEQHEWPPATPPGALRHFVWQLHFDTNGKKSKLDLVAGDFAGEVFRAGFGREGWSSAEAQELKEYIDQSDALLLLINLKDYINEQDISRKSETEWALKNCLDYAERQQFRQIAIAFTQIDRYEAIFAECNDDHRAVLNKYLPQIAGAHPKVKLLRIAAVSGTTLAEDSIGLAIERPADNFISVGIPELLSWVSETETRTNKPTPITPPTQNDPFLLPPKKPKWVKFVIVALIVLVIAVIITLYSGGPQTPKPVIISEEAHEVGTGIIESYGIDCTGTVVNNGAEGNVTVHVEFIQGTKTSTKYVTQRLGHGESFHFDFTDTDTFLQRDGVPTVQSIYAD